MKEQVVQSETMRTYYDEYDRKLLSDYVYANPRAECAIQYALSWLTPDTRSVLDIGRGIGWSSWEIKRHYPRTSVVSVDLSPKLTEIAQNLFPSEGIIYKTGDITEIHDIEAATVDIAVLLDVYEHIPRHRWTGLHSMLDRVLRSEGIIVLTFPSTKHQAYLRRYRPNNLQPIDEDIARVDIETLAEDIHGQVIHFEEVSVWSPGDYVHAAVGRVPGVRVTKGIEHHRADSKRLRKERIQDRLGRQVLPNGVLVARGMGPSYCIITPNPDAYSETFIRGHIENLPANTHVLFGGHLPTQSDDGRPLTGEHSTLWRLFFRITQQLRGLSWNGEAKRLKAIEGYLRKHRIQAVLAEYGPTGVAMMEVCQRLGIPLIVHFHGYDAYRSDVLEGAGKRYPDLFQAAGALVVVSKAMQEQLLDLGAPKDKLHYNPYGVDMSLFRPTEPGNNPPVFVGIGRFVDKKAPYLTLLAFSQVIKQIPEARLTIVGNGDLWEPCQRISAALGITSSVDFPGAYSHQEVNVLLQQARAFVQHSVRSFSGDSEGTPVAVIEAGAAGLPVVATRHAGISDVVIEDETGLLVDEGDVDGMAEAMLRLAREPQLATAMGQAARRRVEKHFALNDSIANLWKIIQSAMDSG